MVKKISPQSIPLNSVLAQIQLDYGINDTQMGKLLDVSRQEIQKIRTYKTPLTNRSKVFESACKAFPKFKRIASDMYYIPARANVLMRFLNWLGELAKELVISDYER